LPSWCVWIEPAAQYPGAEARRWSLAVEAALAEAAGPARSERLKRALVSLGRSVHRNPAPGA
jgi:hypothetical protein